MVDHTLSVVPSRSELLDEIEALLQPFNKTAKPIVPETDIMQDLNVDSLAIMNFMMALEDKFDISIPLNVLPDIRTVDDLITKIEQIKVDG